MPAFKEEIEKGEQEGVKIQFLTLPVEVSQENNWITLKCTKMELGADESGRPRPVPIEGSEFTLQFDAVIGAIGEEPDYSVVPGKYLNEQGRLKIDSSSYSLGGNIFAGGDFVSGPSTVIQAISAGRQAASRIDQFLRGEVSPNSKFSYSKTPEKFNGSCLERTKRVIAPELPINMRIQNLDSEDISSLERIAVTRDADRCFNCGCVAVNPSDLAPVLIALGATIVTSRRTIFADDSWDADETFKSTVLENDEIVTEIQIPEPRAGVKSAFIKFALRKSIDFPIVNCAAAMECPGGIVKFARICLNSVYSQPYRVIKAEDFIKGKPLNEANAEAAGAAAMSDAMALPYNRYNIQIAKALITRAILACR